MRFVLSPICVIPFHFMSQPDVVSRILLHYVSNNV